MKNGKRKIMEGTEQPNQERIRTLGEKENYKYLPILKEDTIKQVEMKEKIRKENLRWPRKLIENKLIKGINTMVVPFERYSEPFLK